MESGGHPWNRDSARRRTAAWIEHFEATRDQRAIFLRSYALICDTALATAPFGKFHDPAWVLTLLDRLADYYFLTVEPDTRVSALVPRPWRAAHRLAGQRETTPGEALTLGVNAQINNDLPRAVCDLLGREWPCSTDRLNDRQDDLGALFGVVVDAVGRTDPSSRRVINSWRADAWESALALLTAADRQWREAVAAGIECIASRRAHLLVCAIDGRDELVILPAPELQRAFPQHPPSSSCRLDSAAPAWSDLSAAAS
jgi:hypothetical protein